MSILRPEFLKRLIVPALVLIFSAPMLVSWWLLKYSEYGKNNAGINHGQLIEPPRPLHDVALTNLSGGPTKSSLHGKWSLVYLHAGKCEKPCVDELYKMRQLRLALGEYSARIQRVLVQTGDDTLPVTETMADHFPGQLMLLAGESQQLSSLKIFNLNEDDRPLLQGRLYLIDPLGNLMMTYPRESDPSGIIKDLKRLLRYSRIG